MIFAVAICYVLASAIMFYHVQGSVYLIDPVSCTPGMQVFIRKAMNGAFTMATSGMKNLNSASNTVEQNDLTTWLLGSTEKGDQFIGPMYTAAGGVLRFNHETSNQAELTQDDLKIYCDQKRLVRRISDPLHLYDNEVEQVVGKSAKMQCNLVVLAYVASPDESNFQLQLCPWFLKYGMTVNYPTIGDLPITKWQYARVKLVPLFALFYAPIDVFSLSDKVFLHELTHARHRPAPGQTGIGPTDDVGGWSGYGWKNCKALALATAPAAGQGPEDNADTWALYGSASLLNELGGTVNKDGSIKLADA